MDLYVERQCVDQMKEGKPDKFLMLFDSYYKDFYKYVARRVKDRAEVERIVRTVVFDALGQVQNTPTDISYLVWLYSLARPMVWSYLDKASMPEVQGLIAKKVEADNSDDEVGERAEKMFAKLSLEEREILRLKFFEQVSDGDVMTILGVEEANVGPKIYRVLKRAHFLLFGESDERQGVYFGELTGFMEQVRERESLEVNEVLALTLKNEITTKIERKEFAVDVESEAPGAGSDDEEIVSGSFDEGKPFEVKAEDVEKVDAPWEKEGIGIAAGAAALTVSEEGNLGNAAAPKAPVQEEGFKEEEAVEKPKGSNDPAKIFVEAVAEMKQEEALNKIKEERRTERKENLLRLTERFKWLFTAIPVLIFIIVVGYVAIRIIFEGGIKRGYPTECNIEVAFNGDFTDGEMRKVNEKISGRICGHFENVESLEISRVKEGQVDVAVDLKEWLLDYNFVKKIGAVGFIGAPWKIKKYAKTVNSDGESREV